MREPSTHPATLLLSWVVGRPLALLPAPRPTSDPPVAEVMASLLARWQRYEASAVDRTISPVDDMYATGVAGAFEHYWRIGREALALITEAMVLARVTTFQHILDLPCGGGRVTRHLAKFFPDAVIYAGDVDRAKMDFVVAQFDVQRHEPTDFTNPSPQHYDLIFVGSLLTHLPRDLYDAAVDYFIDALTPGGVLMFTSHGRVLIENPPRGQPLFSRLRASWALHVSLALGGFGYNASLRQRLKGIRYGSSLNTPSWAMQLIERRGDATILGFKERAWDDFQDVLMVRKSSNPAGFNRGSS